MIDLLQVCKDFCEENEITFVTETPKGINIDADSLEKNNTLMWLNVIESATIGIDTYGSKIENERNIEIVFFKDCKLEDDGDTYYSLLQDLRDLSVALYKFLLQQDNTDETFSNFLCENGVDQLDHNCVMQLIRFSITESTDICE